MEYFASLIVKNKVKLVFQKLKSFVKKSQKFEFFCLRQCENLSKINQIFNIGNNNFPKKGYFISFFSETQSENFVRIIFFVVIGNFERFLLKLKISFFKARFYHSINYKKKKNHKFMRKKNFIKNPYGKPQKQISSFLNSSATKRGVG